MQEYVRVSRLYKGRVGRQGSGGGDDSDDGVLIGVGHGAGGQGRVLDVVGDEGSVVSVKVVVFCFVGASSSNSVLKVG